MDKVDWQKAGDEALELFSRLLRMQTINAPDGQPNKTDVASMLAELFRSENLEAEVLESAPAAATSSAA